MSFFAKTLNDSRHLKGHGMFDSPPRCLFEGRRVRLRSVVGRVWWCCAAVALLGGVLSLVGVASVSASGWQTQDNGVRVLKQSFVDYDNYRLVCSGTQAGASELRCEARADRVWNVQVQAKNPNRNTNSRNRCDTGSRVNLGHYLYEQTFYYTALTLELPIGNSNVCVTQGHTWVGTRQSTPSQPLQANTGSEYVDGFSTQFDLNFITADSDVVNFTDGVAKLDKSSNAYFGSGYVGEVCFGLEKTRSAGIQFTRSFFSNLGIPETGYLEWCVKNQNDRSVAQADAITDVSEWAKFTRAVTLISEETSSSEDTSSSEYSVPASLIADVQGYAAETGNGDAHVDRWKRVLVAFGEDVPGFGGTAMSAAEAKQHAQTFWSVRWDPVVAALTALEAAQVAQAQSQQQSPSTAQQQQQQQQTQQQQAPSYTVPAQLIADVQGYAAETTNGGAHVDRWKRVLVAFGEDVPGFSGTAMTAAEAKQHAQTFWSVRWDPVVAALTALEAQPVPDTSENDPNPSPVDPVPADPVPVDPVPADPPPVDPPVVDPVVSVTAGADVVEGTDAVFTFTASPAPTAPFDVTVAVSVSGDYGVTAGTRTVTVPTTGTVTLSVATTDDSTDEADGSVTATVTDGTDYNLDTSAVTATVSVADNDDPPPPPPPATNLPSFSVIDGTYTEGSGYYFFFVILDKPVNKLTQVSYTVEATGNGPGHASVGDDFVSTTRTIFFRPGLTRNIGLVTVKNDNVRESNETFRIVLSNPQGATIGNGTATITIKDND